MLFKKTAEITEYASIDSNTNFYSLKATLRKVETVHLMPVLGKELYNYLNTAYASAAVENDLDASQKELLSQCRSVIAPYLCYYFAPKSDVKLSDSGMQRHETSNSKTAYQEQRIEYREANLREGESAEEILLEFLEQNKTTYTEWTNSRAFAQYRSLFIRSGKELDELFPSHTPYRNYWAIRSKMVDVEENIIRPAITNMLFDALKAKCVSSSGVLTENEEKLLFKLKKAIACLSIAFAAPFLNVRIDVNGISVLGPIRASRDEDAKRTSASDLQLANFAKASAENGNTWLSNAVKYITQNPLNFPLWAITPIVVIREEISVNQELNASFGMF